MFLKPKCPKIFSRIHLVDSRNKMVVWGYQAHLWLPHSSLLSVWLELGSHWNGFNRFEIDASGGEGVQHLADHCIWGTPLQTDMEPERTPLEKKKHLQTTNF